MSQLLAALLILALLTLAFQVVALHREYPGSLAWKLLAGGFIIQAVAALGLSFVYLHPVVHRGLRLVGLIALIAGWHVFNNDLKSLRKYRRLPVENRLSGQQPVKFWLVTLQRIEAKLDRVLTVLKDNGTDKAGK